MRRKMRVRAKLQRQFVIQGFGESEGVHATTKLSVIRLERLRGGERVARRKQGVQL